MMITQQTAAAPVAIVVGGGLAGLTAATHLARAGCDVTLYERSRRLGGRARTQTHQGYHFNIGAHALYLGGTAATVLRELGVSWSGHAPPSAGWTVVGGQLVQLPTDPWRLLTTSLLSPSARLDLVRALARLRWLDPTPLGRMSLQTWLALESPHETVRQLLAMIIRTGVYSADVDQLSAGAALAQTQLGLRAGVAYLDGGWQTLVDGLRQAAERAGVRVVSGQTVTAVRRDGPDGGVSGVVIDGERTQPAVAVIIAASPSEAARLVDGGPRTSLQRWAAEARPVRVACLDVALRRLPNPAAPLVLGLDRPLYLIAHSEVARLAPAGGALLHALHYLNDAAANDPTQSERELETLLDLSQPGWRELVVHRQFLPYMTVINWLVTAAADGLAGRPGPAVPEVPGLYVAGDWVGQSGQLADAALASGRQAATMVMQRATRQVTARAARSAAPAA